MAGQASRQRQAEEVRTADAPSRSTGAKMLPHALPIRPSAPQVPKRIRPEVQPLAPGLQRRRQPQHDAAHQRQGEEVGHRAACIPAAGASAHAIQQQHFWILPCTLLPTPRPPHRHHPAPALSSPPHPAHFSIRPRPRPAPPRPAAHHCMRPPASERLSSAARQGETWYTGASTRRSCPYSPAHGSGGGGGVDGRGPGGERRSAGGRRTGRGGGRTRQNLLEGVYVGVHLVQAVAQHGLSLTPAVAHAPQVERRDAERGGMALSADSGVALAATVPSPSGGTVALHHGRSMPPPPRSQQSNADHEGDQQ